MKVRFSRDYDLLGVSISARGYDLDIKFWNWNAANPNQTQVVGRVRDFDLWPFSETTTTIMMWFVVFWIGVGAGAGWILATSVCK